jgi:hypothetical protein
LKSLSVDSSININLVLIDDDLFIFDERWRHYDESESQYLIESIIQESSEINDKMKIQWDEIIIKTR